MKPDLRFPSAYARLVARLRVPGGFIVLIAFAMLSRPSVRSLAIGLPLAATGLWLRAWAAGHLEKNMRLATTGPYAWMRNPLYAGTLLVAAGFAIASRSVVLAAVFAVIFGLVYLPAIQVEEEYLREIFPDFAGYALNVPVFWPRVPKAPAGSRFRFALYRRNEEYQALLGFLAGTAWLVVRLAWWK